jgi:[acyl-carrier-protein] S-malonyltransferase
MLVILCPGQGSQTPGFLTPWLELPSFAASLESMSEASGIDLAQHGTISDADTIRDTKIAQPLIVGAGVATLAALRDAGLSLSLIHI